MSEIATIGECGEQDPERPVGAPVRWNLDHASAEFGCDRRTLRARLVQAQVEPGKDGRYATGDIHRALSGDLHCEKLERAKADRLLSQIRAAEAEGMFVLKSDYVSLVEDVGAKVRLIIETDKLLSPADRDRLLRELQKVTAGPTGKRG